MDVFPWIELASMKKTNSRTFMVRNHFVRVDDEEALSQWRMENSNTDLFVSVCKFAKPYRDSAFVCDFFLDVDSSDLNVARDETLKACDLLIERLGVGECSFDIAFSGSKGFHVRVPRVVFGNPDGCMRLWHVLARKLSRSGVKCLDLGVYQASRVLRLVNSVHSTTGLFKFPLDHAELLDSSMESICERARQSRDEDDMSMPEESPKAVGWFAEAIEKLKPLKPYVVSGGGWSLPACVRSAEGALICDGCRHDVYFAIARSYAAVGASPDEIFARLQVVDERNPIRDADYIKRVAGCAHRYGGLRECPEGIRKYCPQDEANCLKQ